LLKENNCSLASLTGRDESKGTSPLRGQSEHLITKRSVNKFVPEVVEVTFTRCDSSIPGSCGKLSLGFQCGNGEMGEMSEIMDDCLVEPRNGRAIS
jgi:hypothetical protein